MRPTCARSNTSSIASQVWPLAIENVTAVTIIEPSPDPRYRAHEYPVPLALNWTASRATLNVTIAALALARCRVAPTPGRLRRGGER